MKLNYNTCLSGQKCVLVPYRPEHVSTYHGWMQDPQLLEMTCSEPLTLSEEIEMQKTWMEDEDKCTFIVLVRNMCSIDMNQTMKSDVCANESKVNSIIQNVFRYKLPSTFVQKNLKAMAGDVNLFLNREYTPDDSIDDMYRKESSKNNSIEAELDIMIAEKIHQQRGLGSEAVRLMMFYGIDTLGITRFFVKIKDSNVKSRNLFEKKLGFRECNYAACFQEVSQSNLSHLFSFHLKFLFFAR